MLDNEFGDGVRQANFRELAADDQFLSEISLGNDDVVGAGACGTDAFLAELLSEARESVHQESANIFAIDDIMAQLDAEDEAAEAELASAGVGGDRGKLSKRQSEQSEDGTVVMGPEIWWKPSRIGSAFLGAAASMALFAGGFSSIQSAGPDSALWSARVALFGDETASVELASVLDEVNAASSAGDIHRAEQLLAQAEQLMGQVRTAERDLLQERLRESVQNVDAMPAATQTIVQERTVQNPGQPVTVIVTETVIKRETATSVQTETVTLTNEADASSSESAAAKSDDSEPSGQQSEPESPTQ